MKRDFVVEEKIFLKALKLEAVLFRVGKVDT